MKIGLLKEPRNEKRVALLPANVKDLVTMKHEVWMEHDAGHQAFFDDTLYQDAGASIGHRKELLGSCDLLVQIQPLAIEELESVKEKSWVLSQFNALQDTDTAYAIKNAGLTAFSMDLIPRTTRAQSMDVLSSMATVAGYKAVLEAARLLPQFFPMFMTAAGTIKPVKLLVLGAGVAGLQAIATARKLGAQVEAFDVRSAVKEEVQSLGGKFIEVEGARDEVEAGGYAVEQTEAFKERQQQLIHDHASKANVVITTAQIPGRKAPLLLSKETVEQMMPGSVIIDLAASTGGNCEVTQDAKTIVHNHVTVVGESNFPAQLPADASKMYGNNIMNFLKLLLKEDGTYDLNFDDDIVGGTCLAHKGEFVNERVKQMLNDQ
jgi:NAD(P) transhydrogenase subunit alpha